MERIFALKLENGAELEVRSDINLDLNPHDKCVFTRDFFTDMGEVVRELDPLKLNVPTNTLPLVQRLATPEDLETAAVNTSKNGNALETARLLIENLGLEMKLINAHSSLDGKLMTIQFSAEGRVDFRELVKELSRALCQRIELRQIGVRDETGIYGGISVCGQVLCCCRFLKEFNSINVKMAKEQDLSLTPSSISGICGRLKCCLKFEHEGYVELAKDMPRKGEMCETANGPGRITDRNLLRRQVSVTFENGNVRQYPVSEIKIIPSERRGANQPPHRPPKSQEDNGAPRGRQQGRNNAPQKRQPEPGRKNQAPGEEK